MKTTTICWLIMALICGQANVVLSGAEPEYYLKDYRGVIHCHSDLSSDAKGRFPDIVKAARRHNVDFIVVTDHWSSMLYKQSRRGLYGRTLFIAGLEISKKHDMSLLAIPLPKEFLPSESFEANVSELKRLGSVVLAGHMELADEISLVRLDGFEITNLHALAMPQKDNLTLAKNFFKILWHENWNLAFLVKNIENLNRWRRLELKENRIFPAIIGNDSHGNIKLTDRVKFNLSSYENTFPVAMTHVWAAELTEAVIMDSIRAGRMYCAFEVLGASDGLFFSITDGSQDFLPGSTVEFFNDNLWAKVVLPLSIGRQNGDLAKTKVEIIRNGKPHLRLYIMEGREARISINKPGIYGLEISKGDRPWIFTNSIMVK